MITNVMQLQHLSVMCRECPPIIGPLRNLATVLIHSHAFLCSQSNPFETGREHVGPEQVV